MPNSTTYRAAGVDIDAGEALVAAIRPLARATTRPGVVLGIGSFAGAFLPSDAGYSDPVLFAATDGVGTKLKLACAAERHDTIGQDLVAMCVNDLVVHGAEPLFFLDYFATSALRVAQAQSVIGGIAKACQDAGCALLGGETAEMPGMYTKGEYDLAGFAVGAAPRNRMLPKDVRAGDLILGLASDGVHANGFSLIRRVVADAGLRWSEAAPFAPGLSLQDAFLAPTRLYVKTLLPLIEAGLLKAAAHITGGGIPGNLVRVLPRGTKAIVESRAWSVPPVFRWLAKTGGVAPHELIRVFNCGIGMALVVTPEAIDEVERRLRGGGERTYRIGRVEAADGAPAVDLVTATDWLA